MYNKWKPYLSPSLELIPLELAGRGTRMNEPLYKDLGEAIDDIFLLVKDEVYDTEYAFFGHSMGATIGYEVAQKLIKKNYPVPRHMFFSGRGAPHVRRADKIRYHLLEGQEFIDEVIKLGGTPREFFEHTELMSLILPMLKNDFRLSDSALRTHFEPFDFDISIMLGKEDNLSDRECNGWKAHTNGTCTTYHFNGGHFFIHEEFEKMINIIENTIFKNQTELQVS